MLVWLSVSWSVASLRMVGFIFQLSSLISVRVYLVDYIFYIID
jgi:hypothetical protein